ncbi:MAG: RNA polymerase sigma factor [Acidobacteria bacterium]|nr:RNA polymerase sigma factor [Acidobacteriota bacterium]
MEAVATGSDAELMLRVKEGDEDSFAYLLSRHRDPVVNYLYRMVQNAAVAEELAQDVFLRVYRARLSYEPSAKFTTWLYRIATRVALNFLRDGRYAKNLEPLDDPVNGRARELRAPEPNIEQRLVAEARQREIRQAVLLLPDKQRAAVILHKYQELDYKQIAETIGCSESAVKSLLFRAYEILRVRLAYLAGEGRER